MKAVDATDLLWAGAAPDRHPELLALAAAWSGVIAPASLPPLAQGHRNQAAAAMRATADPERRVDRSAARELLLCRADRTERRRFEALLRRLDRTPVHEAEARWALCYLRRMAAPR